MKTVRNLVLIMVILAINTVVLNAQCCGKDSKKSTTSCNHEKDSTNKSQIMKVGSLNFKVDGKCDMCKDRIEKAALGVKGVQSAVWDTETHQLSVNLNGEVKPEDVYQAVANAGHDNEKFKATDKAYKALPKCCKYRI